MKKLKMGIFLAVLCYLCSFIWTPAEINAKTKAVKINEKNFPDMYFRYYIKNSFDKNEDNKLSAKERKSVKKIDVGDASKYQLLYEYPKAETLKGIEYFPNLEVLDCSDSELSSLNISKNKKLRTLYCNMNSLDKLDLSAAKNLRKLNCSDNYIDSLKISGNKKLTQLFCDGNQLEKLDVKKNKKLVKLSVTDNKMKKLKVENLKKLKELYCDRNQLTTLKVTENRKLVTLNCCDNKIKKLFLKKNKKLDYLACSENRLRKLNLSQNRLLQYLYCDKNQMVSGNCQIGSRQLENYKVSKQTRKIKVERKGQRYFIPLPNLLKTNALSGLSQGRVTAKGIWIEGNKCPDQITYEYNMFTDGKVKTKVVLKLAQD